MNLPDSPVSPAAPARSLPGARTLATRSLLGAALWLAPAGALFGAASAQVPENHVVVGTIGWPGAPGASGLFQVSLPTSTSPGGTITPLSPLPKELTVASGVVGGCHSVLRRPADGTLFVGDAAGPGGWYHVHILEVAGPFVLKATSVRLGQVPNIPGNSRHVGGLALLPDGRILIAADTSVPNGPMSASPLAILDTGTPTPTLTPIQLSSPLATPFVYGVALSPDGGTAYVISQASTPGFFPGRLYAVDITSPVPVAPVLLHTWPNGLLPKITAGRDGLLYSTTIDPVSASPARPTVEEIRVTAAGAAVKSLPISAQTAIVGPALDRAGGRFVFVSVHSPAPSSVDNNSVLLGTRTATGVSLKVLASPPTGGWGMPLAIDINDALEPYGRTAAQARHWFEEFPNPGGLPEVGNLGFSLTLASTITPVASFVAIGLKRADFPLMGVRVLVDPAIVHRLPAPGTSVTLPLRIPNLPALRNTPVFVQAVHVEAGGWAATRGLQVSIL